MMSNNPGENEKISELAQDVLKDSKKRKKKDVPTSKVFSLISYGIKKRASLGNLSPEDLKVPELVSWRFYLNVSFLVMLIFSVYGFLMPAPEPFAPLTWIRLIENWFGPDFIEHGILFLKHPYGIMFFIVAAMGMVALHIKPSLLAPLNLLFLFLMVCLFFNFLKFNAVITTIIFFLLFPTYFILAHYKERFVLRELYAEQPRLADPVRPLYVMIGQAMFASLILEIFCLVFKVFLMTLIT